MYPSLSTPQTLHHSHTAPPTPTDPVSAPGTPGRTDRSSVTNKDVTPSWTFSYQSDPSCDTPADPILPSRTLSYPQEPGFTSEMTLSPPWTTPQREGSVLAHQSVMPNCEQQATRPHVSERDVDTADACNRRLCGQCVEQECRGGRAGDQVLGTLAQQGGAGRAGGGWRHVCDDVSNPRHNIHCSQPRTCHNHCNQPCTPGNHHNYNRRPYNLCCPRHEDPHPHHHHSWSPDDPTQEVTSKLCSPGLVLVLLLLLSVFLLVLPASNPQHKRQVSEKAEGSEGRSGHRRGTWEILKKEEEEMESTGEVLPGTVSLLSSLPAHYHAHAHAHAHALTVHQPDQYASDPERDIWYFTSLQQRDKMADKIDIFLHSSVEQFLLTLHLQNGSKTTYNLSLFKGSLHSLSRDAVRGHLSSYVPSRRFPPSTGTWLVADVTKYLRDWLLNRSEFSVELRKCRRTSVVAGRQFIDQGGFINQPVVCVQDYNTTRSRDADRFQMVVKNFLTSKVQEVVTERPGGGGVDGGAMVPVDGTGAAALTTHARTRREASTQCQVSQLLVSIEDLGLLQVVYPTTFFLNYCWGSCHVLDHPSVFSTNALLRAKYRFLQGSGQVPAPHCTPVRYQDQPLFVWREGHLTMIRVDDLDATSCGCR